MSAKKAAKICEEEWNTIDLLEDYNDVTSARKLHNQNDFAKTSKNAIVRSVSSRIRSRADRVEFGTPIRRKVMAVAFKEQRLAETARRGLKADLTLMFGFGGETISGTRHNARVQTGLLGAIGAHNRCTDSCGPAFRTHSGL